MLIWTNFDSFAITYLNISSFLQKFHFSTEAVLNSLQTQKGLELVSRLQFLQNFLMKFFLWGHSIITFALRGGGGVLKMRTKANGGGGFFPSRTFAKKIFFID